MSVDTPGFTADQFRHIRVLLLRHDARASAKAVRQGNKIKLLGGPKHHLLAPAGHMRQAQRRGGAKLNSEIAIAHRIQGVFADAIEIQQLRDQIAIGQIWCAR